MNNTNNNQGSEKMNENNEMKTMPKTMNEMEIEALDYRLSRLLPGRSTCIKSGEWAYLSLGGSLYRLANSGYYAPYKGDMWQASVWLNDGRWGHVTVASGLSLLMSKIEQKYTFPRWERGFGKGATEQQEVWA